MHGNESPQQKHSSSQAGNPSGRWGLYALIVINLAVGTLCTAPMVLVAVYDARGDLSYEASVGLVLLTVFVLFPIALVVLAPAAVALLAMMIGKWSALSWRERSIAGLALVVGGIPPAVVIFILSL